MFLDHTAALGGGEIALLHLVQRLDPDRYAPVVVLGSEGPLKDALRQAGIETHVLPLATGVTQTSKDSLGVRSLLRLGAIGRVVAYTLRLTRFIQQRRVDLVHTNSLKADVIGGAAARLARVPVVWHVRDRIDSDYLPAAAVRLFRWLCRTLPDCVVANSRATLDTIRLPRHKPTAVVYSGVVLEEASGVRSTRSVDTGVSTERVDLTPDGPLLGIVGRISPWKGQHIFIQAAAAVRERFPDARFQIIGAALFGEEAYEAEIRSLVASLGLDDCLEFTGFRKDARELIRELDILVHASTTGEPFGQVVVQGMAAGKPVVATDGGGVPEIVVNGVTGLLVPMGDAAAMAAAISDLLADRDRAQAMGAAGLERVRQHFTIEQTVRTVENVYETILERVPAA